MLDDQLYNVLIGIVCYLFGFFFSFFVYVIWCEFQEIFLECLVDEKN